MFLRFGGAADARQRHAQGVTRLRAFRVQHDGRAQRAFGGVKPLVAEVDLTDGNESFRVLDAEQRRHQ